VTSSRLRLFVALDLPGALRAALAAWARDQLAGMPGVRPLAAESLHVTLCFLGAVDQGEADGIAAALAGARSWAPAALAVADPVWLPRRRPNVLAVGLADGSGELARLQSALGAWLVDGGWYEPERRPFLAHVTVARVRRGAVRRPSPLHQPPTPVRFTADRVTLYRSHTGAGGARYEPLASVALGGGSNPSA
jgi:2'-5' RNA ligase